MSGVLTTVVFSWEADLTTPLFVAGDQNCQPLKWVATFLSPKQLFASSLANYPLSPSPSSEGKFLSK